MAVKVPKEEQAIRNAVYDELDKVQLRAKARRVYPEWAIEQIIDYLDDECVVSVCGGAVARSYKYRAQTTRLTAIILKDSVWISADRYAAERIPYGKGPYAIIDKNICLWLSQINQQAANEWARNELIQWGLRPPPVHTDITNIKLVKGTKAAIVYTGGHDKLKLACTKYGCWPVVTASTDLKRLARYLAKSIQVPTTVAVKMLLGELTQEEADAEIALGKLASLLHES